MNRPPYLNPFVLSVPDVTPERRGIVDLYLPDAGSPAPAIVFVHGGPLPAQLRPTPRDWPTFRGYASLAASRGVVGVTVDHPLHTPADYPRSAAELASVIESVRADPRVDADRIALWFFSGGGMLSAAWLRDTPSWLRCLALTYPMLAPMPGMEVDPAFRPAEVVAGAGALPIVLTRVGLENPPIAETVAPFVAAAGPSLTIVDVPNGQHGFDMLDHTDESRAAVIAAFDAVHRSL